LLPSAAGRAENVIRIGYGEGAPGDTGIEVMVTAANDVPIHGYSLAFTYPSSDLELEEISIAGTHMSVVSPDFVAPGIDNSLGIGILGVIFSFSEPVTPKELPPLDENSNPRIIARLVFNVRPDTSGGVFPLSLNDGIGHPASFNRFTRAGLSVKPRLEDGTVKVAGGNVLTLDKKIAFPGATTNLPILAYAQHPQPLDGFQIGLGYDKSALTLTSATHAGTSLGVELQNKIELFTWAVLEDQGTTRARAEVGTLFDYSRPYEGQRLSPSTQSPTAQSLVKFTFDVLEGADATAQYQDILLENTFRPGRIDNRFIVGDVSLDPELNHGKVYFSEGNLVGRVTDSVTFQAVPGVKVMTDPDKLSATTGVNGTFRFQGLPPGKYALVLSASNFYTNRLERTAAGSEIMVLGSGADSSAGDLPIYRIPPWEAPRNPFLRGFVNKDNNVDLSDAVFVFQFLFLGGPSPQCRDAANVNDDSSVDISDGVYLLNFLFLGTAAPPPPFPSRGQLPGEACSLDPTGGSLGCVLSNCP
jgi:hypothetical protein